MRGPAASDFGICLQRSWTERPWPGPPQVLVMAPRQWLLEPSQSRSLPAPGALETYTTWRRDDAWRHRVGKWCRDHRSCGGIGPVVAGLLSLAGGGDDG